MAKPTSKSPIDPAAAGPGSLNNALRTRGTAQPLVVDQSTIADILSGNRSASAPASKSYRGPRAPAPLPSSGIIRKSVPDRRGADVAITSIMVLGELIRQARLNLGLNQQRFADLANVGRRFVSELEAGKPSLETERVLRCCATAGIDIFARPRRP